MTDRQRSKLRMVLAVVLVCGKPAYRALWNAVPAFVTLFGRVQAKVALIEAYNAIKEADRTGVTRHKNDAKSALILSTENVAGLLVAYALLTDDAKLRAGARLVHTDLTHLPETDLDDRATDILNLARAVPAPPAGSPAPPLAATGLSAGMLDILETRIETYNLLIGTPRAARGEVSSAVQNVGGAFTAIDELLEDGLDRLMLPFRPGDFFKEYESARVIVDPAGSGGGARKAKGKSAKQTDKEGISPADGGKPAGGQTGAP